MCPIRIHGVQSNQVGFDGGKKVDRRKRHILVDTLGLILVVFITTANAGERCGLQELLLDYFAERVRCLRKIWVDGGYSGEPLLTWVHKLKKTWKISLEVVEKMKIFYSIL
ncbi:transposase [Candidatus Venteria ishoeyi]|uniref:transposase n=1 Tax=Candidatus Venteria ishoeyi TaxID=1899563 RepID=UPI00387EE064